jgi:hypothetical protein
MARLAAVHLDREGPVHMGRASAWLICQEKAHRAIASLSMRLRLSPQHRADSRSAGRKADDAPRSIYEIMRQESDAADEG